MLTQAEVAELSAATSDGFSEGFAGDEAALINEGEFGGGFVDGFVGHVLLEFAGGDGAPFDDFAEGVPVAVDQIAQDAFCVVDDNGFFGDFECGFNVFFVLDAYVGEGDEAVGKFTGFEAGQDADDDFVGARDVHKANVTKVQVKNAVGRQSVQFCADGFFGLASDFAHDEQVFGRRPNGPDFEGFGM